VPWLQPRSVAVRASVVRILFKFLWPHGIPGSGKSILCWTVRENIKVLCSSSSNYRFAYFYFDFNDTKKQKVLGLLRSVVAQLGWQTQYIPDVIQKLYNQNRQGIQQLGEGSLTLTLFGSSAKLSADKPFVWCFRCMFWKRRTIKAHI
jgi:hypothetical protein